MTREETIMVLGILRTSFPRFYANMKRDEAENTISLWQTMFATDDVEEVKLALYKIISTNEFPPTIAEMRKALSSVKEKEIISAGEAWGEVTNAIRRFGYMQEQLALESMSEVTRECVRFMGWVNLCQSEESMADRAHFLRIYDTVAARKKEEKQLPLMISKEIEQNREKHSLESVSDIVMRIGINN